MTRDEIEALTPDALTALLAERVMGWTRCEAVDCQGCDHEILPPRDGVDDKWSVWKSGHVEWHPTTDANDLRELLERTDTLFKLQLTCDPLIICRAVALAVCGGEA